MVSQSIFLKSGGTGACTATVGEAASLAGIVAAPALVVGAGAADLTATLSCVGNLEFIMNKASINRTFTRLTPKKAHLYKTFGNFDPADVGGKFLEGIRPLDFEGRTRKTNLFQWLII